MSVIFGIVDNQKIIIAGDKRLSSIDGDIISDDGEKIFVIHEKLAVVSAGNAAIEKAIRDDVKKINDVSNLTTDNLINIMDSFYKRVVDNNCISIYNLPFYCLIVGMGKDGNAHLINAGKFKNGFGSKEVPMALYNPSDTVQDDCNKIFVKNYKLHHKDFCERTVREISKISKIVSPTGNKWEYDITTQKGQLYSF